MHPPALTRSGRVEGLFDREEVRVFRGIPYARAPLGELRFRAPEPCAGWSETRPAREFGPAAPQEPLITDVGSRHEDCLTVNVWTPGVDRARRPVMVWLHGGAFHLGGSAQAMYDAAILARAGDVVVVSLNYRLGALGFAYLPELLPVRDAERVAANLGLRDQVAALGWVRDNIEQFGGDPENITLFGESAGAMSIGCLLAAPSARGLFRRAILQSGGGHHVLEREQATQVGARLLRELGLSASQTGALWSVSAEQIVAAQRGCAQEIVRRGRLGKELPHSNVTLLPVVDGEFLPEHPIGAIERGAAAGVELIVGSNLDEWNFFLFFTEPKRLNLDRDALRRMFAQRLPDCGPRALALYAQHFGANAPAWKSYAGLETDRTFRQPAIRLAETQSVRHARTFMYQFEFGSQLFESALGACHALEIPFVFGTLSDPFGAAFVAESPAAQRLSAAMLRAWVGFARDGEPNHAGLPEWPAYDVRQRATLRLADQPELVYDPLSELRQFWDALI